MNEKDIKIAYFSHIPSNLEATLTILTKAQAEKKFGIQWRDFNIDGFSDQLYKHFPTGHEKCAIAEMDERCGKGVFARVDMSAGTLLFCYGGQTSENEKFDYYILERVEPATGESIRINAQTYRNYGGTLQHLPTEEQLTGYDLEFFGKQPEIATQNVRFQKNDKQILVIAEEKIKKGNIMGYSYGDNYWIDTGLSPLFFTPEGEVINSVICNNVRLKIVNCEDKKDMILWSGSRKLLLAHCNKHTGNYLTFGPKGDNLYVSPYALKCFLNANSGPYLTFNFGRKMPDPNSIGNRYSIFSTAQRPCGPFEDSYVTHDMVNNNIT